MKSLYVYVLPKSKWPARIVMTSRSDRSKKVYYDYHYKTGEILGVEIIDYVSIEVNGVNQDRIITFLKDSIVKNQDKACLSHIIELKESKIRIKKLEKELKVQKGKRWVAEARVILSSKKNGTAHRKKVAG